ncbi:MAG: hypothetical protein L0Y79_07905 [Chlorobi bacterium]|nr:hypothetical protein [Chlorobiota bacterium]MCI0716288.1 hypothetical protein [Chlorobiota bacterium]
MKKILIILFLPVLAYSAGNDSLVGVWQDMNIVGSGWSNSYLFFNDGSFKFFFSQMDCSKRMVSYSGKWQVSGEALLLAVGERVIVEGGIMVKSTGSCASDSTIEGGIERKIEVSPPEQIEYAVSRIYKESDNDIQRDVVYIDMVKFWKFSDDPNDLLNQFEGK